jgi:hypothetical protein
VRKVRCPAGATAIVALLLVLVLGACGGTPAPATGLKDTLVPPTDTPIPLAATPTPSPAPPAALTPASPPPPAHSILEASVDAIEAMDAWHFDMGVHMTVYAAGLTIEVPLSYAGDFTAPDRMQGTASMSVLGVTVEKDTVLTSRIMDASTPGTGEGVGTVRPVTIFSLLNFAGLEVSKVQDLEFVGEENLDGMPVYHLRGGIPLQDMEIAPAGVPLVLQGDVRFEVWIGVGDSLPRQGGAEAELTVAGAAEGSLHVTGTATFSDYGLPVVGGAPEQILSLADTVSCDAGGEGFAAYSDEEEAIRFCYPSGWVVDDLVDSCGYISVSPAGVAPDRPVPGCLAVLYPDATVARFGQSAAGAVEVSGKTALCFIKYVTNAVLRGDPNSIFTPGQSTEEQQARSKEPLDVTITGIQNGVAKSVSLSGALVEATCRPAVDKITYSVVVGKPPAR